MEWEEVKQEVERLFPYRPSKKRYCETDRPSIKLVVDKNDNYPYYIFTRDGMVFFYYEYGECVVLANHRTPDQIFAIIKALQ
jgi:ligand-binding sensor domain-containing protein